MQHDATEDPLRSMIVDRVTRDDGRYLIYYSWPAADAEDGPPQPDDDRSAGDRPDGADV